MDYFVEYCKYKYIPVSRPHLKSAKKTGDWYGVKGLTGENSMLTYAHVLPVLYHVFTHGLL